MILYLQKLSGFKTKKDCLKKYPNAYKFNENGGCWTVYETKKDYEYGQQLDNRVSGCYGEF